MRTVYKYKLRIEDEQVISLPSRAKILSCHLQQGVPCIWAEIDTETDTVRDHVFFIRGTGHKLGEAGRALFLATLVDNDSGLVWHVYQEDSQP